jgi:predicted  nucleic acid-binding Zn-ribbon protein
MPEKCKHCGDTFEDFADAVLNSSPDCGPMTYIPEEDG